MFQYETQSSGNMRTEHLIRGLGCIIGKFHRSKGIQTLIINRPCQGVKTSSHRDMGYGSCREKT